MSCVQMSFRSEADTSAVKYQHKNWNPCTSSNKHFITVCRQWHEVVTGEPAAQPGRVLASACITEPSWGRESAVAHQTVNAATWPENTCTAIEQGPTSKKLMKAREAAAAQSPIYPQH